MPKVVDEKHAKMGGGGGGVPRKRENGMVFFAGGMRCSRLSTKGKVLLLGMPPCATACRRKSLKSKGVQVPGGASAWLSLVPPVSQLASALFALRGMDA